MGTNMKPAEGGVLALAEIREFAGFDAASQRYIRRSLDVAFDRNDAIALWSRDLDEAESIREQMDLYEGLPYLRERIEKPFGIDPARLFLGDLVSISVFDLGQARLAGFGPYRFLYERLMGARVRPWLPAAFCAAASMPALAPPRRRALLQSISEAAATAPGWSPREPIFMPEWVEKVQI